MCGRWRVLNKGGGGAGDQSFDAPNHDCCDLCGAVTGTLTRTVSQRWQTRHHRRHRRRRGLLYSETCGAQPRQQYSPSLLLLVLLAFFSCCDGLCCIGRAPRISTASLRKPLQPRRVNTGNGEKPPKQPQLHGEMTRRVREPYEVDATHQRSSWRTMMMWRTGCHRRRRSRQCRRPCLLYTSPSPRDS